MDGRVEVLMVRAVAVLLLTAALMAPADARPQGSTGFDGAAVASWITDTHVAPDAFAVLRFRRTFELPERPARFVVHLSADNRYRFAVNGTVVASGPQRSDLMHWRYDTVDLAPYLQTGRNTLAALVWNWGPYRPVAQFSRATAFVLQGDDAASAVANSDTSWRVIDDGAYAPIAITTAELHGYYAAPPGERVDAARVPWGWERRDFDDARWTTPAQVRPFELRASNPFGEAGGWQLVARSIPMMEEHPVRFTAVRRADGVGPDAGFLDGTSDLVVPAHTNATLLLDRAELTNAYAFLDASGGAGATVTLTYAEALVDAEGRKGHRDSVDGKAIIGVRDVFRFDGGAHRRFRTLWFRTFRYVQLAVETNDEPLRIHDVSGVSTGYPLVERARFTSDAPWLQDMWRMNWRSARLCAWETYFDTPYYEQLQYVGDTRVQSLLSLYIAGDDRLVRQAIEHFDLSRTPEGITASRYPSSLGQYIPTFSLVWVTMLHDYWMLRGDAAFVRRFLPGIRSVLAWYERRVDGTGLLGPMPWWNFVDWVRAWPRGVPPGADAGHSLAISFQLAYTLERAAELETALGEAALASRDRELARSLRTAARQRAWDAHRGLFRDALDTVSFSQHTNTLALLAGAVPAAERGAFMTRVLADTSLQQATYYFRFYLFEAMREAGLADRYVAQLEPWREMLAMGLTTTPEEPEPTRSDSHAWSAHPNYGLLATVLGVRPSAPGFARVTVAPALGQLQQASGRVPHPRGDIEVSVARVGTSGVRAEVALPAGVDGVFEWRGRRVPLHSGRQTIVQ